MIYQGPNKIALLSQNCNPESTLIKERRYKRIRFLLLAASSILSYALNIPRVLFIENFNNFINST